MGRLQAAGGGKERRQEGAVAWSDQGLIRPTSALSAEWQGL